MRTKKRTIRALLCRDQNSGLGDAVYQIFHGPDKPVLEDGYWSRDRLGGIMCCYSGWHEMKLPSLRPGGIVRVKITVELEKRA